MKEKKESLPVGTAKPFEDERLRFSAFCGLTARPARANPPLIPISERGFPMTIERIGLAQRYCDAAIFEGIIFLAGHVAEKTEGKPLAEQTEEVLALLEETLESAGSDKGRLLSVQIFLTDIAKIGEMNAVWDKWVAPGSAPARATVEAKLASPGYAIEITAVAAKKR